MTPADRLPLETRRLLALAWPVVMTSLNWTLLHVTDVAVVGLVSTDQVAILSASRSLSFITIVAGLGFSSGILVFAARADGAGELAASGRVLREGLILALGLGSALGLILYCFASPLLLGLGVAPRLVPECSAARGFGVLLQEVSEYSFARSIETPAPF